MADVPREIDVNPKAIIEKLDGWVDATVRMAPNIAVGLIVLAIFIVAAIIVRRAVMKVSKRRGRANLGEMLGGFAKWTMIVIGALLAATIVFPSIKPGELVAGLGVSSVAIGFAFKDILQNWLAGLLILVRQPFQIGDQIKVDDYEGTVQHIETRATIVKTYDGQRAVIPNSTIYTNPLVVKTGHDIRRTQYDIGIGYGDDISQACDVILGVLEGIPDIETDPAPQALPWDLAASWVTIRARWWTDSSRADVVLVRAKVIQALKEALDDARIDMPYETTVRLHHDQTESADGDRGAQREGWPAPKEGTTEPRWKAEARDRPMASASAGGQ